MFAFDLSQNIQVETRRVVALPTLFGDLGGLYGFFAAIVIFVLGRYQSGTFSLHQL